MDDASEPQSYSLRLRRGGNGLIETWHRYWQFGWFRMVARASESFTLDLS